MAAVGAEVTGSSLLSPGVVTFFIFLLLLSIFLTALCSDCNRRSFELQDSNDQNPSALVRVVKLEEAMVARENPMIDEIRSDEKDFKLGEESTDSFTPWRSHLGAPQNHQEANPEEKNSVQFSPWRSHLGAPESHNLNTSTPPASDHIYHTIGGGRSSSAGDADMSAPAANRKPGDNCSARSDAAEDLNDRKSVYAQVSKKVRPTTPPVRTPEKAQVEEEELSPPLPEREAQLEG